MDVVIEDGDELSILASEDLHILEGVLTVVALAGTVTKSLRPDQDSVTVRSCLDLDVLALVASDHELGPFEALLVEVVHIDVSIGLLF